MGRAPCCDKANVKKGPWSPEEDAKLKSYIQQHGTGGNWIALPQKIGLKRCGKSCRLRWLNYLRPNIKHGGFSEEEDNIICSLYISIGSRWSVIAAQLPGRTDNDIKNYWNTRLKKKLLGKHRKEQQQGRSNKRNGVVKQESDSSVPLLQENSTTHHQQQQQPYWPENNIPMLPPLPYTNPSPSFNDQDSIRKLLIKLGGSFSNDSYDQLNLQFPNSSLLSNQQVREEQVHVGLGSSPCIINNTNNNNNQLHFNEYCADLVQGQGATFTSPIEETVSTNNYYYPKKLSTGLEFLYGEGHMINANNKVMCTSSFTTNWNETETNSLVYPSLVASNYEGEKQEMPRECDFQGYQGTQ